MDEKVGCGVVAVVALLTSCALSHRAPPLDVGPARDALSVDTPDRDASRGDAATCDLDEDGFEHSTCGGLDCDDRDPRRRPGALETCDAMDEDCDGLVDEGLGDRFHLDADGDGHGDPLRFVDSCAPGSGYVELGDDCDDGDATRFPGAPLVTPQALYPENGAWTGSLHAGEPALRPLLRWEPLGACDASFEVHVDDSCVPGRHRDCSFPSPESIGTGTMPEHRPVASLPVAAAPPVGRRYYWRVRQCAGASCSGWSSVRYLDVGRTLADFNGDGYADVAANLRYAGTVTRYEGAMLVYRGGPAGIDEGSVVLFEDPDDEAYADFGAGLSAVGDVNADGFGDLGVGAPHRASRRGELLVYYGGPDGIRTSRLVRLRFDDADASQYQGETLARAGDVNGDGFADVAVGGDGGGTRIDGRLINGRAAIVAGGATGVEILRTFESPLTDTRFGTTVAGADLDGDGFADVAMGDASANTVYLSSGRPEGPGPASREWRHDPAFPYHLSTMRSGAAGRPVLVGAFNRTHLVAFDAVTGSIATRDTLMDWAVQNLAIGTSSGAAALWYGTEWSRCRALIDLEADWTSAPVIELCADDLGWSDYYTGGALLDVTGDGRVDPLMSITGRDAGPGRFVVWLSPVVGARPPDQVIVPPPESTGRFGMEFAD
jgi:hypothetical protein